MQCLLRHLQPGGRRDVDDGRKFHERRKIHDRHGKFLHRRWPWALQPKLGHDDRKWNAVRVRWRQLGSGLPLWQRLRQRQHFFDRTRRARPSHRDNRDPDRCWCLYRKMRPAASTFQLAAQRRERNSMAQVATATLGGTLNISLINGFVPTIGSKFKIVDYTSESGQFATVNGLAINSSEHFAVAYQGADVLLTVVSGAAPSSLTKFSSIATLGARVRRYEVRGRSLFCVRFRHAVARFDDFELARLWRTTRRSGYANPHGSPAKQLSSFAFPAHSANDDARMVASARSDFRVPMAFATMAEHHAPGAFAGIVSAKPYASSSLHSNLETDARFGGKVARSNLRFLPNLYSRPRVSFSLD